MPKKLAGSNASGSFHPGPWIKTDVIPKGMSVTQAAKLVGVGRPALSNLLNGNASLTADMASRLEKAFNYPSQRLITMQVRFDADRAKRQERPSDTVAFVPPFLQIKANELEQWVTHNILARSRFAVFLRTLVHSTASAIVKVDFPGNDDAERHGMDGFVNATEGTPWVPAGKSHWEFGINEDPKTKADGDFKKSLDGLKKNKVGRDITFVFVTPRRWIGKAAWVSAKKEIGEWKDVRAYDASDLEQWLEQSLPGQIWFSNETCRSTEQVRSLDKCWSDWAAVTEPKLHGALFGPAIDEAKSKILPRFSRPVEGPILIAADSTEEALAFISELLSIRGGSELLSYRDRVIVFDKAGVLPRLAIGAQGFIPVVFTREVERELAPYSKTLHSIIVYPRNTVTSQPDIILEPPNYETFKTALEGMGFHRDKILRLAEDSGRSLTVLRRQLSTVQAVRIPEWAGDLERAKSLVPFLLVGVWNSQSETDKSGLSQLANGLPYDDIETVCQSLTLLNDAPIWSVGTYRGVVSKIDLLHAIAVVVTRDDLTRYFSLARKVLGEDDPALDLEESKRWAASMHGKTREFSSSFRKGISETLVLLATHGTKLFKGRLGLDPEQQVLQVIRDLLPNPLTTRILEANDRDLPTYAEAAPDEFLSIIERDLKSDSPAVLGLLRPVDSGIFGSSPSRTGLLWALEGLAWSRETLPRAAAILARLAEVEIKDNWINKPANSLQAIFSAWMPQTSVNLTDRVALLKQLAVKFPVVVWNICVTEFGFSHRTGHYSHKPRSRPDGFGFGEPVPTWGPINEFRKQMVDMALDWKSPSFGMLCDLVERIQDIAEADQPRVWGLVETWAKYEADDAEKALMRERIRVSTLSRRAALQAKKLTVSSVTVAGKAAYDALEPHDVLNKHAWLFRDHWVEESVDEIEAPSDSGMEKRDSRIKSLRVDALNTVLAERGLSGILELSARSKASSVMGALLATEILPADELGEILHLALVKSLGSEERAYPYKHLVAGMLNAVIDDENRRATIQSAAAHVPQEIVSLLLLAPFGRSTWNMVDELSESDQNKYWLEVMPSWVQSDDETVEAVERLLKAQRPRAAFSCVRFAPEKLDASLLFQTLSEMVHGGKDQPGHFMLEPYDVKKAFERIDASHAFSQDEKAGLEFAYIEVLAPSWQRSGKDPIPNLQRYVESHPEIFVQAVVWTYRRRDGAPDPTEFRVPDDRKQTMAERGYKLLEALDRIPGLSEIGSDDINSLRGWISSVRTSCAELDRAEVADISIGRLLSHASVGADNVWPSEQVREVMEELQSESIMNGAQTGVYNSRGVYSRGEDSSQERDLADKYRSWGRALQFSHPFVASKLLRSLAETYDHEANREDAEAEIRRRLR